MENIKAIFFDFDDTLVGTAASTELSYKQIAEIFLSPDNEETQSYSCLRNLCNIDEIIEHFKIHLKSTPNVAYKSQSPDEIRIKLWQNAIHHSLKNNFNEKGFCDNDIFNFATQLYKDWRKIRLENLKFIESETANVLRELRKNYTLLLLTNGSSVVQWEKIKQTQIEQFFDYVIVSGDEMYDKPHTSIFNKACLLCGFQQSECAMVGDTIETDITGANEAKLGAAILYARTTDSDKTRILQQSNKPMYTVTTITQLLTIFNC